MSITELRPEPISEILINAHEVTPRMGAGDLLACVEPGPYGLPVRQSQCYFGRRGLGRPLVTTRAGHLTSLWFQVSRRGTQCCPLSVAGLLPVGVPPHLDRQLQKAAAQGCRPLPIGRVGEASIGPTPGSLRGDQILGESRTTHTPIASRVRFSTHPRR